MENKTMKKHTLLTLAATIMLASTLFINIGNATNQTTYTIQTNGSIAFNQESELTVILRGLTLSKVNPNQNIIEYVNNYVGNYSFAQNMIVVIGDLHIGGILQYPNQFNSTYGTWAGTSWTYNQIKTLIDAFHSHGWKTWWGGTAIAWTGQWEQNYITTQHPELGFTDANGQTANDAQNSQPINNIAGNKTVGYNRLIPNFWANFTSPDKSLGIENNTRLIDIIASKLGQIIASGLIFDGWFPSDGWNGFNIQGYNFASSNPADAGRFNPASTYSFSFQDTTEWEKDVESGYGLNSIGQPTNWSNWNITQKAEWILTNSTATITWHQWWCNRFSKMYLQMKNTIIENNPRPQTFYNMIGADGSCQWTTGNLGGAGLINFTMIANDNSIDRFQVDPENIGYTNPKYSEMPKEAAYTAALVKTKDYRLTPIIGIQATSFYDNKIAVPEWSLKQQYLAQVQNYIWYNGNQYQAAKTTEIAIQYPPENPQGDIHWATTSWNNTAVHNFFDFVKNTVSLFNGEPVYLGPTYVLPYVYDGWTGNSVVAGINYTIAQWADLVNLKQNASNINKHMGTLLLDQANLIYSSWNGESMTLAHQKHILQLFTERLLNIIIAFNNGQGSSERYISNIFENGNESEIQRIFGITPSTGLTSTQMILESSEIQDTYANTIASPYFELKWSNYVGYYGVYTKSTQSFIPIAEYSDGKISMGICYNLSTSKFLYMNNWAGMYCANYNQTMPREVVNKAIYWVSDSPIESNNSLLDYKIFRLGSKIIIPVLYHNYTAFSNNDQTASSILKINSTNLELDNISNYKIYWQSDKSSLINAVKWSEVPITMKNMADILIIELEE